MGDTAKGSRFEDIFREEPRIVQMADGRQMIATDIFDPVTRTWSTYAKLCDAADSELPER